MGIQTSAVSYSSEVASEVVQGVRQQQQECKATRDLRRIKSNMHLGIGSAVHAHQGSHTSAVHLHSVGLFLHPGRGWICEYSTCRGHSGSQLKVTAPTSA